MKIIIPDYVLSTELQNEAVLLNLETGQYFGLNEVGVVFWQLLKSGTSLAQAKQQLLNQFDVPPPVLEADLQALMKDLVANRLITIDEA